MLYLIRHGTSEQGLLRLPGDQAPATMDEWSRDHGLAERGRLESAWLKERLARIDKPDRLLASPRRRTQETAALACAADVPLVVDERLHEWHADETIDALYRRTRVLLEECESGTTWAFSHGGFIRAVIAALVVGEDFARFEATFHDLRRVLHIWNCSLTIVGHGGSGLELLGVNLHPEVEAIAGRP